ncbi:pentatricopeptide repeat-containing protein At5g66520 [Ziziphus jujuba]|uniref:Pentatricopeptide repeat-containing protein At5g66520 n=1 Tax=Ziziphus jujuba TaxID=326968 RepID=A0A6P4BFK9_ZIZJJ|nr:pentatricopeptide repeat-containing protein At5g66520 [Ziziphus jujuba]
MAMASQIGIVGAGQFVRTHNIPRLAADVSDVAFKAICNRAEKYFAVEESELWEYKGDTEIVDNSSKLGPPMVSASKTSVTSLQKFALNSKLKVVPLLESCMSLKQIKQAHAHMITTGLILRPIPANKLLKLLAFSSFASLSYAHRVFDQIPTPDLFHFNTMIKSHILSPTSSHDALMLFRSMMMQGSSILPNQYTFVFVLKACGNGLGVLEGEQVRVHAIKVGLEGNLFVTNALIGMYAKWGSVEDATKVFDWSTDRDLYSWNIMVGGYVGLGKMNRAMELFNGMRERDVVSWSTIIAGYVQVGCFMEALDLFHRMLQEGPKPNQFTLVSALTACANLVALDQGRWIHVYIGKNKITMNERLLASLIDMYVKCGEIEFASKVFSNEHGLKHKVWPWNAMIGGFAMHGKSKEAIHLFEQMKIEKVSANNVTFVALLNACSHGDMVEEGRNYFKLMASSYGIEPQIEHYGCMVDLLGRAGLLKEAEETISSMPVAPDAAIWGALLGACRIHKDIERGERIGNIVKELDPNHIGCQVLLANMYSVCGRWKEARIIRENIEVSGRKKTPGCTSIELNGRFHQFLVGDRSHPETKQLYLFLDEMASKLKIAGYVPRLGEVLLDIDEEEDKETALSEHSEKLAIAFGLMNTAPGTPIRIVKNLRVCGDCHQATKYISKVYDREIIVRDRIRYHHFKGENCSCKDYW